MYSLMSPPPPDIAASGHTWLPPAGVLSWVVAGMRNPIRRAWTGWGRTTGGRARLDHRPAPAAAAHCCTRSASPPGGTGGNVSNSIEALAVFV